MNNPTSHTTLGGAQHDIVNAALEAAKQHIGQVKAFAASGDNKKASRLISMAFMLFSVGQAYVEETVEILTKYGLLKKKLKTRMVNLVNCFDLYNAEFEKLLNMADKEDVDKVHKQIVADYDIFREACDRFMTADVRIGRIDAINRDDLRTEAVYLCQVKDCLIAPVQCFKWNGSQWLEFVRSPFPKWTPTNQTITYVIDRARPVEE